MKTVILDFHTDEQAERFFESFAGVKGDKEASVKDRTEQAIDTLLDFCGVASVHTKKEQNAYMILAEYLSRTNRRMN